MNALLAGARSALHAVGVFFDVVEPEPAPLNCGCVRADNVIIACPCGHTTCEHHRRIRHDCKGVHPCLTRPSTAPPATPN